MKIHELNNSLIHEWIFVVNSFVCKFPEFDIGHQMSIPLDQKDKDRLPSLLFLLSLPSLFFFLILLWERAVGEEGVI